MRSPFTGGNASLQSETRIMDFRKEQFEIQFQYYLCEGTGEQFTDDVLDEVNTNQVYNQYRVKYGIPFPEEIKAIREQYGLSTNKMADILGLGINVYRNYEAGEMPSVSNGRLIQIAKDPEEFKKLINYSKNEFTVEELEKINKKINYSLTDYSESNMQRIYEAMMLGEQRPTVLNGYKIPTTEKISQMILYFAEHVKPFKTKLNKLLFYADFHHFRKTCFSISGMTYKAIQNGPVPKNYDWIFDNALEQNLVEITYHDFGENIMGEQFLPKAGVTFNRELFTESELNVMSIVAKAFEKDAVKKIVNKSHEEQAWLANIDGFGTISYDYSFQLKHPVAEQN